ncbi:MAG: methylated-DNA--[protein]-cysteine S-methyltransferase [Actinomycetota bacterium]|nr:methylated-DNA--[protein]-cysteine S-methyltransferase [Actinomycetota bacterium]
MTRPHPAPLAALTAPLDHAHLDHLRHSLARRAEADGLLDVAYRTLDSPLGTLLVAATAAGVVRLALPSEDHDGALALLARRVSPRLLHAPGRLDGVAGELDEYFAGRRRRFEVPLDLQLARGFRLDVLHQLVAIDYGATASYAEVAAATGRPRAVRAVGTACATNPLPLLVPCHRVLRTDGSLGGYAGGLPAKAALLDLERRVRAGAG